MKLSRMFFINLFLCIDENKNQQTVNTKVKINIKSLTFLLYHVNMHCGNFFSFNAQVHIRRFPLKCGRPIKSQTIVFYLADGGLK